ncbi:hypothetical protein [Rhodococcus sp. SJ-3]|uniref:hypothetical protein n=1 Tax=Rhodococcus sp. SJ-3 TaxID=3454628 RepID=UPI003F79EBCB
MPTWPQPFRPGSFAVGIAFMFLLAWLISRIDSMLADDDVGIMWLGFTIIVMIAPGTYWWFERSGLRSIGRSRRITRCFSDEHGPGIEISTAISLFVAVAMTCAAMTRARRCSSTSLPPTRTRC